MLRAISLSIFLFVSVTAQTINYLSTFPKENSQKINNVTDFDISEEGNYLVVDQSINRLLIFNSNGDLLNQIPKEGSGYIFEKINAVALDGQNKIWILDSGRKSIAAFDRDGNKIIEFGKNDGLRGAFETPIDITVDLEDNIYVADLKLQKILKFSNSGIFTGDEFVFKPISISASGSNRIYVLAEKDENDFYVISFSPDLKERNEIKISNLQEPVSLSVNMYDEIYISDKKQNKVFIYSSNGNIKNETIGNPSSSKGPGKFANILSVKVKNLNNEKDYFYAADGNFNYIQQFEIVQLRNFVPSFSTSSFSTENYHKLQTGDFEKVFADENYLFVLNKDKTISVSEDGKDISVLNMSELLELSSVVVSDNYLFACDSRGGKIFVFDFKTNKLIKTISENEVPNLSSPGSITKAGGQIFVLDSEVKQLYKFSGEGQFLGTAADLAFLSTTIKFLKSDNRSNIYIIIENSNYIFVFNSEESKISQIRLPLPKTKSVLDFTVINENLTAALTSPDLNIILMDNFIEEFTFLSKGTGVGEIPDVSRMFFNQKSREFLFVDNSSKSINSVKIKLKDEELLKLKINDLGYAELIVNKESSNGAQIQLFKRISGNENFNFVKTFSDSSFVIFDETNELIEYSVKIDDSDFSNVVEDNYTYAKSIKDEFPYKAIAIFQSLVELNQIIINSEIKMIYRKEIDIAKKEQKYNNALKLLSELQKLEQENYVIYIEKSELYEKINQLTNAVREVETAVDKFPEIPSLVYRLIDLKKNEKKFDEILVIAERSLQKFPQDEILYSYLAEANKNLARTDDAARYYKMLAQRYNSEEYYIKLADIHKEAGNYDEAIKVYEEIKNKGLETSDLYAAIARTHISQNQTDKALEQIQQGLSIDKENSSLHFLLAKVYFMQGKMSEAEKSVNKAIDLNENSAEFYILRGDIYNKQGNIDESVYNYESAVLIASDNIEVLKKLGMIYLEENKIDYAYKHLTKAKSIDPGNKEIIDLFETAESKREELNALREPVEFNYIEVGEVSSQNLDYYDNNYFGYVTIFNTRNFPLKNCVIEINCGKLSSRTVFINVDTINPNEYSENYFEFLIDREMFDSIPRSTKTVPMEFSVRYNLSSSGEVLTKTSQTTVDVKIVK